MDLDVPSTWCEFVADSESWCLILANGGVHKGKQSQYQQKIHCSIWIGLVAVILRTFSGHISYYLSIYHIYKICIHTNIKHLLHMVTWCCPKASIFLLYWKPSMIGISYFQARLCTARQRKHLCAPLGHDAVLVDESSEIPRDVSCLLEVGGIRPNWTSLFFVDHNG